MLEAEVRHALRDVALDVRLSVAADRPLVLAGRSGAGKTTILRAIAGTLRPDAGRIACGGDVWLDERTHIAPERRRCALLPQDLALFPHLSAWRNAAYGLRGVRGRRARRAAAVDVLERLGVADLADARDGLARRAARRPRCATR